MLNRIFRPTTSIPEGIVPPKKKDPLPAIINMDLVEKEQREKQQEKEKVNKKWFETHLEDTE